jgi:hypothetical protein
MDLKTMAKVVEKFELRDPITLNELFNLMMQSGIEFPGKFKMKKGLLGPYIGFDTYMTVQPRVKVKGNRVTVRKINVSMSVGVGRVSIDVKDTQQRLQAAKTGGLSKALTGGPEYFINVIEKMRELLKTRLQ